MSPWALWSMGSLVYGLCLGGTHDALTARGGGTCVLAACLHGHPGTLSSWHGGRSLRLLPSQPAVLSMALSKKPSPSFAGRQSWQEWGEQVALGAEMPPAPSQTQTLRDPTLALRTRAPQATSQWGTPNSTSRSLPLLLTPLVLSPG